MLWYGKDAVDALKAIPSKSVHSVFTGPPYYRQRVYQRGEPREVGRETTCAAYVGRMVEVFHEVQRVLRSDGTLWLNLDDTYVNKQLLGVPWRVANALQDDGWWLRAEVVLDKLNAPPEAVRDRPDRTHEHLFLFSKSRSYYYDAVEATDPTKGGAGVRNRRSVWATTVPQAKSIHTATTQLDVVESCLRSTVGHVGCCSTCFAPWSRVTSWERAPVRQVSGWRRGAVEADGTGREWVSRSHAPKVVVPLGWAPSCRCPANNPAPCTVIDPFSGTGTTGVSAVKIGCHYVGIDLNPAYLPLARSRLTDG